MISSNETIINYFYKIMWCEFSTRDTLTKNEIIHFIGECGLNTLITYNRLREDEDGNYRLDKSYI